MLAVRARPAADSCNSDRGTEKPVRAGTRVLPLHGACSPHKKRANAVLGLRLIQKASQEA